MVVHEAISQSPLRCEARRVTPALRPFLFNREQARRLLVVAGQLPSNPRAQARGEIYKMIFALLYGLGLRVGEASRLCRKDIDLDNRLLLIRQTKFGKDRLVPFGPHMAQAIAASLETEESRYGPIPLDCAVFSFHKQRREEAESERPSVYIGLQNAAILLPKKMSLTCLHKGSRRIA